MKQNSKRTKSRRWVDRKHRREIGIVAPLTAAGYVTACLATGCPITQWPTLVGFAILGAAMAIPITYFVPGPVIERISNAY